MEELYKEYENVKSAIKIIENKMDEIYDSDDWRLNSEKYEKRLRILFEEKSNLFKELETLEEKIITTMPPVKSNGIIDLRYLYLDSKNVYGIYIHNTDTCVGNINYRGQHTNDFYGDIGYGIDEKYRGNGYAYQALSLLGEKLYEDGITDFWVGIYDDNIASIKTVQRYGGKIIKRNGNGPYALLFQCETKKLDMENNIVHAEKKCIVKEKKQEYEKYDNIYKQIKIVDGKMDRLFRSNIFFEDKNKYYEELRKLNSEKVDLYDKLDNPERENYFSEKPIKYNNLIDLRIIKSQAKAESDYYNIYIHNTRIPVGSICYRGYHNIYAGGDIGYTIEEEYRGNGYAYEALTLLGEKLYEEGISDFWIIVYDNENIASIKTILKYGGKLIKINGDDSLLFQCETKKLDMENNIGHIK